MASLKNSIENIKPEDCNTTVGKLFDEVSETSLTSDNLYNLWYFCAKGYESVETESFSEPVVWIGVYIAAASFICILCILKDIFRLRSHHEISSKYTSLNVTSMMVITIAMKLTVDMTGSMPSNLDQMAKIGSVALLCTMMAILNPSLASMNKSTLLSNIIGLIIFILTIAVNLIIEIRTGVIRNNDGAPKNHISTENGKWEVVAANYSFDYANVAYFYIGIMVLLLLISISTAINIPSFKKILEFKYQVRRKALKAEKKRYTGIPTVEELTQHVTKYWIMAKTGSPQFVMACNLLSFTSLVVCVTGMCLYVYMLISLHQKNAYDKKLESDYKWSISVILWTQVVGNVVGIGLVGFRCTNSMKFIKGRTEFKDLFTLKEKKYWTLRLFEWKRIRVDGIVHFMKKCGLLNLLVWLQKILVVLNRCLAFGCIVCLKLVIIVLDVLRSTIRIFCCKARSTRPILSRNHHLRLSTISESEMYVLYLDDKAEPSQEFLGSISMSMKESIKRAEKKQSDNLLELLGKKSKGFKGFEISFNDIFPLPPLFVELNSWGVPVIILTCIAIAVPDIKEEEVKNLIESIDEALLYTRHVEKSFNSAQDYANIRKTALALWDEIRSERKWWEEPIKSGASGQLPKDILTRFADKAAAVLISEAARLKETTAVHYMIGFPNKLIAAELMQRITHSILSKIPNDQIQTNKKFFEFLCSMIADTLLACFSNIPQVIMMKCHADEIEKREASVLGAVELLGRSTKIIEKLMTEHEQITSIDLDKRASFEKWCLYFEPSSNA